MNLWTLHMPWTSASIILMLMNIYEYFHLFSFIACNNLDLSLFLLIDYTSNLFLIEILTKNL